MGFFRSYVEGIGEPPADAYTCRDHRSLSKTSMLAGMNGFVKKNKYGYCLPK